MGNFQTLKTQKILMKTKLARDIPIGVLLIVLALWCISIVQYLAGWPDFTNLIGIVLLSMLGLRLLSIGYDVISGIQVEDTDAKK